MQKRFATHPEPEVRLLARKCAREWTRAAHREKAAARAGDGDDDARSTRTSDARTSDARTHPEGDAFPSDAPPLEVAVAEKKEQTVDEMIASADGLAEGGAAADLRRARRRRRSRRWRRRRRAPRRQRRVRRRLRRRRTRRSETRGPRGPRRRTRSSSARSRSSRRTRSASASTRRGKKSGANARPPRWAARASAGASADVTERLRASAAALEMDVDLGPRDAALREIRKHVLKFAHAHLQKSGAGKKMGKEKRDAVCAKTAAKVCENSTSADAAAAEGGDAVANFLTQQRKSKIKKMLDAYVARLEQRGFLLASAFDGSTESRRRARRRVFRSSSSPIDASEMSRVFFGASETRRSQIERAGRPVLVALRVAMSGFSGAVKLGDLDDFINPSQSCVVALNGDKLDLSAAELAVPEGGEVLLRKRGVPSTASTPPAPVVRGAPLPSAPGEAVKVSLSDCLACSGCVTSAETVLLEAQSAEAFKRALSRGFRAGGRGCLRVRRRRRSTTRRKIRAARGHRRAAVPRVPRRGRGPGRARGAEADGLLQVHRRRARLRRRRRARASPCWKPARSFARASPRRT